MTGNYVTCISWNINGCGNPVKRGKVLPHLKHNKTDIAFLQETHFVKEEALKLKWNWVGRIFHSSYSTKRNGVIILVNRNLSFTLLKEVKDDEGRMICVQALINWTEMTLGNIYAPNKGDPSRIQSSFGSPLGQEQI